MEIRNAWNLDRGQSQVARAADLIGRAQAVVVGAGSGLSAAAGLTYSGERFQTYFGDFIEHYGMTDMYSAGFYPFPSQEEKWAYWSRHIYYNRYDVPAGKAYRDLFELLKDKNYFVITTNVDHQFQKAGFSQERLFATQGDYGLFQCARACHRKLYDNETAVRAMVALQKNLRIPESLVPKCPVCKGDMEVNLRCDGNFVEDEAWHAACGRYQEFIRENMGRRTVYLELGVGMNTPGIIKYPFWQLTDRGEEAAYICVNQGEAWGPKEISRKAVYLDMDLAAALEQLRGRKEEMGDEG